MNGSALQTSMDDVLVVSYLSYHAWCYSQERLRVYSLHIPLPWLATGMMDSRGRAAPRIRINLGRSTLAVSFQPWIPATQLEINLIGKENSRERYDSLYYELWQLRVYIHVHVHVLHVGWRRKDVILVGASVFFICFGNRGGENW